MHVPDRRAVRRGVMSEGAICVDMAQWFDQIPLDAGLHKFFTFKNKGQTYALTRLPMGQRQATEVATAITRLLADFPHDEVAVEVVADNLRFAGSKGPVCAAFATFLERCKFIGAQLNEISTEAGSDDIEKLYSQEYDFLGERYNHRSKTMKITNKVMTKLQTTWEGRNAWSYRGFACHIGVLLYASSTARCDLSKYFGALRAFSAVSKTLQEDESLWDKLMPPMPIKLSDSLAAWTQDVLRSEWVPVPQEEEETLTICVDASRWGWAAVSIQAKTGSIETCQKPWYTAEGHGQSTTSEPKAARAAIARFVAPGHKGLVRILTDHMGLVHAAAAGYGKSWEYNQVLAMLKHFPLATFSFEHIKGEDNPVDGLSRGETSAVLSATDITNLSAKKVTPGPFGNPLRGNGEGRSRVCPA